MVNMVQVIFKTETRVCSWHFRCQFPQSWSKHLFPCWVGRPANKGCDKSPHWSSCLFPNSIFTIPEGRGACSTHSFLQAGDGRRSYQLQVSLKTYFGNKCLRNVISSTARLVSFLPCLFYWGNKKCLGGL